MAAGYSDGTLRVFSIARSAVELKMCPHAAALRALAFSADGEAGLPGAAWLCGSAWPRSRLWAEGWAHK